MRVAVGYTLRTLLFRTRLNRWPKDTVLVFDRYFYDSLVHFELQGARSSLWLLMKVMPVPTVAALLLIRERTILERRPRYSPDTRARRQRVMKSFRNEFQTCSLFGPMTSRRWMKWQVVSRHVCSRGWAEETSE